MARPKVKFTKNEKALIIELYRCGKTDLEVADLMKMPRRTFTHRLGQNDLVATIKEAKGESDDNVRACLYKRATGYSHTETRTEMKIVAGEDKIPRPVVDKVVKIEKEVIPDVGAIAFWLKNRRPDKWREKSQVEVLNKNQLDQRVAELLEDKGEAGIDELFETLTRVKPGRKRTDN